MVILIFWLYLTGIAILLGAELNAESERQAAAQAGHQGARVGAAELRSSAPRLSPGLPGSQKAPDTGIGSWRPRSA